MLITFKGKKPQIAQTAIVMAGSTLIGDIQLAEESSIWFGAILRGDNHPIIIGRQSNIQDQTMIHTSIDAGPAIIGDYVTIGHRALLHGCKIGDYSIIGMGTILLDNAEVGEQCIIGAGSLITGNTKIPPRTMAMGSPCRVKRDLTDQELQFLKLSAAGYWSRAQEYEEGRMG